uniref:C6 domain-containing protein n=1 Tax=Panagrellus redivivus TaxID=6233 RepID=A0A7E4VFQ4_PANRE
MLLSSATWLVLVCAVRQSTSCLRMKWPDGVIPIPKPTIAPTAAPMTSSTTTTTTTTTSTTTTTPAPKTCAVSPDMASVFLKSDVTLINMGYGQVESSGGSCGVYTYLVVGTETDGLKTEDGSLTIAANDQLDDEYSAISVTDSSVYVNAASVGCDGCAPSSCKTTSTM